MAVCSVRSNCVLYLVVVRVLLLCPKLSCVQWSVSGGQEQIDCGTSHQGCVREVFSGIHVLLSF